MHQFKQVDIYHLLFENPPPSNQAALIDSKTGEKVDKIRLHQIILNVAKYLKFQLQLLPGQVVAIYAPNSLSYVYAIFGILAAGGIVTLANPAYTSSELSFQLKDSNAQLVFTMASLREVVEKACSKRIILLDDLAHLVENGIYYKDWRPLKLAPTEVKEKVAFLCYSSGTTGLPKGVELTHWNVSANVQQISAFEGSPLPDEVWIGVLPFYHVYGLSLSIHTSLFQAPLFSSPFFLINWRGVGGNRGFPWW